MRVQSSEVFSRLVPVYPLTAFWYGMLLAATVNVNA